MLPNYLYSLLRTEVLKLFRSKELRVELVKEPQVLAFGSTVKLGRGGSIHKTEKRNMRGSGASSNIIYYRFPDGTVGLSPWVSSDFPIFLSSTFRIHFPTGLE